MPQTHFSISKDWNGNPAVAFQYLNSRMVGLISDLCSLFFASSVALKSFGFVVIQPADPLGICSSPSHVVVAGSGTSLPNIGLLGNAEFRRGGIIINGKAAKKYPQPMSATRRIAARLFRHCYAAHKHLGTVLRPNDGQFYGYGCKSSISRSTC